MDGAVAHRVLTLLKFTVKPALIPIAEQTKIRSFTREIGTSQEAGYLELFDDKVRRPQLAL